MRFLRKASLKGIKKAFVRADLDISLSNYGELLEKYRLDALIPTIKFLQDKQVHPIIAGHIGRPKDGYNPNLSTAQLADYFNSQLGAGSYTLLESLRFNPSENPEASPKDREKLANELASQADIYINESFATCHRDATSITLLPAKLPAYAGLRLEQELAGLSQVTEAKASPKVAIVGGVKESKKEAIHLLADRFDQILVVGKLQKSSEDPDKNSVLYPVDYSGGGLDIGPKTSDFYSKILFGAKTVIWAGPAGAYDQGYFEGSRQIAKAIIASKAYSVVGGGDTIACLNQLKMLQDFDFVSTGGGAMIDFLAGEELPGLKALGYYE